LRRGFPKRGSLSITTSLDNFAEARIRKNATHVGSAPRETLSITSIRAAESRDRRYALSDGNCLSVQMVPTGSNRWRYRYRYADRAKHDPAPSQLQEPRVRQNVLFEFG